MDAIRTPLDYARAVLGALAMPVTENNVAVFVTVMRAEEGFSPTGKEPTATYNPLNLTQRTKTSKCAPGGFEVPIQAYASWDDSVAAARAFFTNGFYPGILAALRRSATPSETLAAWRASPYGWSFTPDPAGWRSFARLPFPGTSKSSAWIWLIAGAAGCGYWWYRRQRS